MLRRVIDLKEPSSRDPGRERLHHRQRSGDGGRIAGEEVPPRIRDNGDLAARPDRLDEGAGCGRLRPTHSRAVSVHHDVELDHSGRG